MTIEEIKEAFIKSFKNEDNILDFELKEFVEKTTIPNKKFMPKLYRYSKADLYNIINTFSGKIFLTDAVKMNDFYEGMKFRYEGSNDLKLEDIVYLKSFSEKENDFDMWIKYGDEGKGICVEYDLTKLNDGNSAFYHLFPVIYDDKRNFDIQPDYILNELKKYNYDIENMNSDDYPFLKDIMPLYLFKSSKWKSEAEWRLVYTHLQLFAEFEEIDGGKFDCKELYVSSSKNLDFDCVSKIIFGPKIENSLKQFIINLAKLKGIDCEEIYLSDDDYKLEQKPIDYNVFKNNYFYFKEATK